MTKTRKVKSADRAIRNSDARDFLVAMGQRVRALRDHACITRKALSLATGISERHLANREYGEGNVAVLVLRDVAAGLQC